MRQKRYSFWFQRSPKTVYFWKLRALSSLAVDIVRGNDTNDKTAPRYSYLPCYLSKFQACFVSVCTKAISWQNHPIQNKDFISSTLPIDHEQVECVKWRWKNLSPHQTTTKMYHDLIIVLLNFQDNDRNAWPHVDCIEAKEGNSFWYSFFFPWFNHHSHQEENEDLRQKHLLRTKPTLVQVPPPQTQLFRHSAVSVFTSRSHQQTTPCLLVSKHPTSPGFFFLLFFFPLTPTAVAFLISPPRTKDRGEKSQIQN